MVSKEIRREKKEAVEGKPKRKRRRISAKAVFDILRTKGLLKQFMRLLKDIFGCFKIGNLAVNFRVGLDNPADTGLLFAIIGPAAHFMNSYLPRKISLQPSFEEAVFKGYSYGMLRLQPIKLIPPFTRFVFSLATVRVLKKLVLSRWKRKK